MRCKVLAEFHDIEKFSLVHRVGDEEDFSDERARSLIERGLARSLEEEYTEYEPVMEEARGVEAPAAPKRGRKRKTARV